MQVSISDSTQSVISELVSVGAYSSPGDVVDQAVALLDLKRKIDEGLQDIESGKVAPLDMDSIKQQVIASHYPE